MWMLDSALDDATSKADDTALPHVPSCPDEGAVIVSPCWAAADAAVEAIMQVVISVNTNMSERR